MEWTFYITLNKTLPSNKVLLISFFLYQDVTTLNNSNTKVWKCLSTPINSYVFAYTTYCNSNRETVDHFRLSEAIQTSINSGTISIQSSDTRSIALPNIVYMYNVCWTPSEQNFTELVNDHTLDVQCTCIQDVWHFL